MPLRRETPPDRLSTILAEIEEGRRTPWLPDEDDVVDDRPWWPWRARRQEHPGSLADPLFAARRLREVTDSTADEDADPDDREQVSTRRERRARGLPGRDIKPHAPLFRSPLPSAEVETRPGRSALVGALAVLVIVAAVFAVRVWSARTSAQPVPLAGSTAGASDRSMAGPTSATAASTRSGSQVPRSVAASAAPTSAPSTLWVHVVGQVNRPGVVRVPAGSRVDDAIRAAGGVTRNADVSAVNLARQVADGEQIHVPRPGEVVTASSSPTAQSDSAPTGSAASGPINLNIATESELDELPGVGPVLAGRIVQWRTENGRFSSVDDLGEVSGIGDKLLAQLRPLVVV